MTSTGGTITRKATWTSPTLLEPGRRVLAANSTGTYAAIADASYSGGLATTGGAMVLRVVGGTPIDAVGWGDAVNPFVEGTAASAPAAGSSLERRPGAGAGNGIDTNVNANDFFVQGAPSPQNGAAPPVPGPGTVRLPRRRRSRARPPLRRRPPTRSRPQPQRRPHAFAGAHAYAYPDTDPDLDTHPDAATRPNAHPCANAHPRPSPTSGPIVDARAIAHAEPGTGTHRHRRRPAAAGRCHRHRRGHPDDRARRARRRPWWVRAGRHRRDRALSRRSARAAGRLARRFRPAGVVASRYGQRTPIRLAEADLLRGESFELPVPPAVSTGAAGEVREGLRITVAGTTVGASSALADGLGVTVDDGTGGIRARDRA